MNYSFSLTGTVTPVIKEFKIANDIKVCAGTAVYLDENGNVNTAADGRLLGVCAEDHSGEKELLNSRANGDRVRVDITRGGVYRMMLPVLTAVQEASENTFVCESGLFDANAKGALVLISKAADSTNTDKIGQERNIEAVIVDGGEVTFTLSDGGTPFTGDRYAYMPYSGFIGGIDATGTGFSAVSENENTCLKVVKCDKHTLTLEAVLEGKIFD